MRGPRTGSPLVAPARLTAVLALATLALTACKGGEVTAYRLEKDAGSLASLATDGSVLAGETVSGETTSAYTRVHADELDRDLAKLADVLESATPEPRLRARTARLARLAGQAAGVLERLEDDPSSGAVAHAAETELARIARTAREIGRSA